MSPGRRAIKLGLRRGWTDFEQSVRSRQDQVWFVVMSLLVLGYLVLRRNTPVEGTDLLLPTVALPSIIGGLIVFSLIVGPAYSLAMEKEDGTLLRLTAAPHGLTGYVTGQLLFHSLSQIPGLVIILVPSLLIFDNLMAGGPSGWVLVVVFVLLGMAATLPLGMIIGGLVPDVQKVGTWGMLPILVMAGISGIFFPIQALWGWLQVVAQLFPMYWLGLGMRSAFLPDELAALEVGGTWRTAETVLVLVAWSVLGLLIAPVVLRRMARRQSGSQVEAAKQAAVQWVR